MKYKLERDTPEGESPCSYFATQINYYLKKLETKTLFRQGGSYFATRIIYYLTKLET